MKIKVASGTPEVAIAGLGLVKTNVWHDVTKAEKEAFERIHDKKLGDAFEVKSEIKHKEEAN